VILATLETHELAGLILTIVIAIGGSVKLAFRWIASYIDKREASHAQELAAARLEREESRKDFTDSLKPIGLALSRLADERQSDRAQLDHLHDALLKLAGLSNGGAPGAVPTQTSKGATS
jgi:uncharacterized protein HemX